MNQPSESLPESEQPAFSPFQQFSDFSNDLEGAMRGLGDGVAGLTNYILMRFRKLCQTGKGEKLQ